MKVLLILILCNYDTIKFMVSKVKTKTSHITQVGGNVFANLGFDTQEAVTLKAKSDAIIAKKTRN